MVGRFGPGDLFAYDELARLTNKDIHVAFVTKSDLLTAYGRHHRRTEEIGGYAKELEQSLKGSATPCWMR